jgi:hypothetical protein
VVEGTNTALQILDPSAMHACLLGVGISGLSTTLFWFVYFHTIYSFLILAAFWHFLGTIPDKTTIP